MMPNLYPHLAPREVEIWERWLAGEGKQYFPYAYDIRVGEGIKMPASSSELAQRIARIETQKRIDAVSDQNAKRIIFEVKPRAGLGAVGQLLGYRDLYRQTFAYYNQIDLMLITDRLQPDMEIILHGVGIEWREV